MSKYHNRPVDVDGIHFDSLAEWHRYCELKLMERAGEIWNLRVHPRYILQEAFKYEDKIERAIVYEADFAYYDKQDKCTVVEEIKGFKTAVYNIKRKMFLTRYPTFKFIEVQA